MFNRKEHDKKRMKIYRKRHNDMCRKYKMTQGCAVCGYNKCAAALEFHHKDKEKKIKALSCMANSPRAKVLEELAKCIVLCSNCHRELHAELGDANY